MAGQVKQADAFDISQCRADFPVLRTKMNGQPLAYLDTAASAQKPQAVIDAMKDLMELHYANIHRGLYALSQETTTAFETVRGKVAEFINGDEKEIIFTRNATEGINLVAQSWGRTFLKAGDEIILTGMEHHANIVPWQLLRDQIGVVLKIIPVLPDGALDMAAYKKLLSPKTRLVAAVHISNSLGTVNPVREITAIAKNHNPDIHVLIDGSQAVVHSLVDMRDIGADFYAFTGHKLYGPTGAGVLWGRYDVLAAMPPYQGGGDMIERVTFEKTIYKEPPSRFEAGTPDIIEVIGLGAALDYLRVVGMDAVQAHEQALLEYAMKKLNGVGGLKFHGTAAGKAGIISFTAGWGGPSDIGMILDQCGVAVRAGHHCCQPLMGTLGVDATVRASLGLYSNKDDIDALAAGLAKAKGMLA
jgi:cysteine desulfurase / selenocysteine lyase